MAKNLCCYLFKQIITTIIIINVIIIIINIIIINTIKKTCR